MNRKIHFGETSSKIYDHGTNFLRVNSLVYRKKTTQLVQIRLFFTMIIFEQKSNAISQPSQQIQANFKNN